MVPTMERLTIVMVLDFWPMRSTDALFDLHGVPREIVIDQHMAKLEVDAFITNLAREEHSDIEIVPKLLEALPAFVALRIIGSGLDVAIQSRAPDVDPLEPLFEVAQRLLEEREHDDLRAGFFGVQLLKDSGEPCPLAVVLGQALTPCGEITELTPVNQGRRRLLVYLRACDPL